MSDVAISGQPVGARPARDAHHDHDEVPLAGRLGLVPPVAHALRLQSSTTKHLDGGVYLKETPTPASQPGRQHDTSNPASVENRRPKIYIRLIIFIFIFFLLKVYAICLKLIFARDFLRS